MSHDDNQQLYNYALRAMLEKELEAAMTGNLAKEFTKGLAEALARGYTKGFAIDFAKEFAKGMHDQALAIAQRMIAAGYDRETIKEITDLTDSQLAELK